MHNYVAGDDDRAGLRNLKDSKTLGSAYDRYLQSAVTSNDETHAIFYALAAGLLTFLAF